MSNRKEDLLKDEGESTLVVPSHQSKHFILISTFGKNESIFGTDRLIHDTFEILYFGIKLNLNPSFFFLHEFFVNRIVIMVNQSLLINNKFFLPNQTLQSAEYSSELGYDLEVRKFELLSNMRSNFV